MKTTIEILHGKGKIIIEAENTEEILKEIKNIKKIISELPEKEATKNVFSQKADELPLTIGEFISQAKANSYTDKIMLIVTFLWQNKKIQIVNTNDIFEAFKEAMIPIPQNLTALMNHLTSKNMLAVSNQKKDDLKSWKITQTGLNYVDELKIKSSGTVHAALGYKEK